MISQSYSFLCSLKFNYNSASLSEQKFIDIRPKKCWLRFELRKKKKSTWSKMAQMSALFHIVSCACDFYGLRRMGASGDVAVRRLSPDPRFPPFLTAETVTFAKCLQRPGQVSFASNFGWYWRITIGSICFAERNIDCTFSVFFQSQ